MNYCFCLIEENVRYFSCHSVSGSLFKTLNRQLRFDLFLLQIKYLTKWSYLHEKRSCEMISFHVCRQLLYALKQKLICDLIVTYFTMYSRKHYKRSNQKCTFKKMLVLFQCHDFFFYSTHIIEMTLGERGAWSNMWYNMVVWAFEFFFSLPCDDHLYICITWVNVWKSVYYRKMYKQ